MDMTPANLFAKRQIYGNRYSDCDCYGCSYYNNGCYYSRWDAYGRWILLAAIIIGAFLIFLMFSCITARRRRRIGQNPYPLTGWASRPPPGHGPAQYTGQPQQPPYGAPQQGYAPNQGYGGPNAGAPPPSYGANADYYSGGGQESGIAHPNQSYQPPRGGDPVYNAPPGPPPGKH